MLLDEHFSSGNQVVMEGPLYVKIESKKVWKRYHFVLRASGIYYYPKEKTKSARDLLCHALFAGHDVYKGIGWKKKHKAPTDFTFALKLQKEPSGGIKAVQRGIKMLCAEDGETLDRWITLIRVAKFGKQLLDNHRILLEDLARGELDKFSSNRSSSIGSIISSTTSHCSNNSSSSNGIGTTNSNNNSASSNGRLSRTSSSSSSGCLSDENNAFDSDFPTGTIKRKPSMKPNLPLTSMTRQLKEVGENTYGSEPNSTSPERGGTLTRRHSRRRSEENGGNNNETLKRRPANSIGSIESMNSSNSTPTPTPSTPSTPSGNSSQPNLIVKSINNNNSVDVSPMSPLEVMPSCMTDSMFSLPPPPDDIGTLSGSTFSLDSLPPPPPPSDLLNDLSASQMSLSSLPPPPAEVQPVYLPQTTRIPPASVHSNNHCLISQTTYYTNNNNYNNDHNTNNNSNNNLPTVSIDECDHVISPGPKNTTSPSQPIYVKSMKPSIKAPPYKSPPPYNGVNTNGTPIIASPTVPTKAVTFTDSPVLLRRKVCFEDEMVGTQQQQQPQSPRRSSGSKDSVAPPPPPRAEATRLSTITSPKRLSDSTSNPPHGFLKDLQRVMRKKWQVAQKCKLEPATTPHEVLGFRDFAASPNVEFRDTSHFYRESSNVSNWVQEHYGGIPIDSLYENLGGDMGVEPMPVIKKRPPPPPPKRSTTTQLTHRT